MKKILPFLLLVLSGVFCSADPVRGTVDTSKPYLKVYIAFNTSTYHSFFGKFYPTFAVWIEEEKSGTMKTVYVTEKVSRDSWIGAHKRPSAIPVWSGAAVREKNRKKTGSIDAITGATPKGEGFTILYQVPDELAGKKIRVYIEANISFDYNIFYVKDAKPGDPGYSDINGQPSVVWNAAVDLAGGDDNIAPVIAGHGHVLGENSVIDKDMSKITTAKDIFSHIHIHYNPGIAKK